MATYDSNKYANTAITADGRGRTVTVKAWYVHPTTATKLTDGDLIRLCKIPAGHEVVSLELFSGDLDAGAALVVDAGTMDATDAALEVVFVSGSTIGQAGGTLATPATAVMHAASAATVDKVLAIEVTTTAAVIAAADAAIGVIVQYAPI